MEPMVFAHDRVHLQVESGILEMFRLNPMLGGYRTPVKWAKIRFAEQKKGLSLLYFGNVEHLDEPLYASAPGKMPWRIEIQTADEPLYRAFFTDLAHRFDRRIAG
ncbi:hypothetical protein GCM10029976_026640 [Kribbella albertanoniae]|uniref:Uncharacterized protein n=1 Tax=Kribbella albertanoniae TaxID=1266829 RepID=A0A4R4NW89_9ACTN|nr:hypothetical protein [Kribbella albertanoniae]TDC14101.1 hypothetical protein E1261_44295 [Kribbella albertanoniae]